MPVPSTMIELRLTTVGTGGGDGCHSRRWRCEIQNANLKVERRRGFQFCILNFAF
jgi:hypothetical protein